MSYTARTATKNTKAAVCNHEALANELIRNKILEYLVGDVRYMICFTNTDAIHGGTVSGNHGIGDLVCMSLCMQTVEYLEGFKVEKTLVHPSFNGILDSRDLIHERFHEMYPLLLRAITEDQFGVYGSRKHDVGYVKTNYFPSVSPWLYTVETLVTQHTRCVSAISLGRIGPTNGQRWQDGGFLRFVDSIVCSVLSHDVMDEIGLIEDLYIRSSERSDGLGQLVLEKCDEVDNQIFRYMRSAEVMTFYTTDEE